MRQDNKNQIILDALSKICKKLRNENGHSLYANENGLSSSVLSAIENGLKEPELTTLFKIAESCNMKASELFEMIEDALPNEFCLIEK